MSLALLSDDKHVERRLSSSIHKQSCYVVTACPRLDSPAIYWSWKDASDVLDTSSNTTTSSSTSESSMNDSGKNSVSQRRYDTITENGQRCGRYNNIFQAIEFLIGPTEYYRIIEAEAKRIQQKVGQQPTAFRTQHIKFQENMKLLRRYVEDNGCLPPITSQSCRDSDISKQPPPASNHLHHFMMQMKKEVRRYQSHLYTSFLSPEFYDQLVSIGFVREFCRQESSSTPQETPEQTASPPPTDSTGACDSSVGEKIPSPHPWTTRKLQKWYYMLGKVERFHKEHKRLPCRHDDRQLERWIRTQKQRVLVPMVDETKNETADTENTTSTTKPSKNKSGASKQLFTDQVVKLAALGVSFAPPSPTLSIETRCQEWIDYRKKHGHNPPSASGLGKWAAGTIRKYRNWKLGRQQSCNITPALIDQLTKAGFVFPTDSEVEAFRKLHLEQDQKHT